MIPIGVKRPKKEESIFFSKVFMIVLGAVITIYTALAVVIDG